ncbi:MAG: FAD-binding protein, partial [Candidatus Aenigmatarchaeota archaeon]
MSKSEDLVDKKVASDVLIIGSEGAGSRAALAAAEQGCDVTIVSKGKIAKSGVTIMAGADITLDGTSLHKLGFAGDPEDSEEKFFRDIVVQGFYINNQRLVRAYVSSAPARVRELLDWGLRVSSAGRREINTTGVEIMRVLTSRVRNFGNIQIIEDVMVTDLLTKNGKVLGAVGVDINTGEFVLFKSKAVILATGGWHEAYLFNTGSEGLS